MEYLLALILLAAVLAILAYPIWRGRSGLELAAAGSLDDLLARRDGAYAMLRDLDLDYELGKLDAADYASRREKYLARAAAALKQLDGLRGADPQLRERSDEIEREVAALRRHAGARTAKPPMPAVPATITCPNCHHLAAADDRFCAKCGQAL